MFMGPLRIFILALLCLYCTTVIAGSVQQSFGFFSKGHLEKASSMELDGAMWVQLFPKRKRFYANKTLIKNLERAAVMNFARDAESERIQLGDFSAEHGGQISGHNSHRNGLDVDVVYLRYNRAEQRVGGSRGLEEEFVVKGQVTSNFDVERNWNLLKDIVIHSFVNRIFVDEHIKKLFCQRYQDETDLFVTETLRRLRPWPNHGDHFHLRIKCPEGQIHCENQVEPPLGDGCDQKMTLINEVAP